jgi:hypothetical protein
MKTRLDYREELVRTAREAAVDAIDKAPRCGAVFPFLPTIDLLTRAWLAGHQAGIKTERKRRTSNE